MKWTRTIVLKINSWMDGWLNRWLNRGLMAGTRVTLLIRWPLLLVPIFMLNQLLTPHRVWTALLVTILSLYALGYLWVRGQSGEILMSRRREGAVMLAGDPLVELFEIENRSLFPLLWAEFADGSELPEYVADRVVACGGVSSYRWQIKSICPRRGAYRLGPATLTWSDPFGLFQVRQEIDESENVLIYPRVPHLPELMLPFGNTSGARQRRRPFAATLRSPTVREYQSGDSLRYVHWPATARQGGLMVTEREMEPGGEVWIVVDTEASIHRGDDDQSTFEYSVMAAAGLASQLLGNNERQSVGLLSASQGSDGVVEPIMILPQNGQAQFWRIMAKLAAMNPADLPLHALLQGNRELLRRGQTILLITPVHDQADQWVAELVHGQSRLAGTVYLIEAAEAEDSSASLRALLSGFDIPVQTLPAGTPLESALTYRRTRRVIRSTPAGGAVALEVEEEVG